MKKIIFVLLSFTFILSKQPAAAQADEIAQLLLNVTKLTQLKQILTDLEKGYITLSKGYSQIENIAAGNFTLHEAFLDGLLQVNPSVKNYYKVAEIITYQIKLVKDYKTAISRFKSSGQFSIEEISYLSNVYGNLFKVSLQQLDELTLILTSGTLRMSDEERLTAIDQIYSEMQDKLYFLTAFNQQTTLLAIQRARETKQINIIQELYRINK